MSYYGDDDADLNNPMFTHKTWVGIVVPLCIVAGIVLIALIFFYRRRHVQRNRTGIMLDQRGRLALERDMEQGYSREISGSSRSGPYGNSNEFFIGPNGKRIYYRRRDPYVHRAFEVDDDTFNRRIDPSILETETPPPGHHWYSRGPRIANRWAWAYTTGWLPEPRNHYTVGCSSFPPPPPYEPRRNLSRSNNGDDIEMAAPGGREGEDGASVQGGITVPAPAHVRHSSGPGSGSPGPVRTRSNDGDITLAATSTSRTADPSSEYYPPMVSAPEETYEASLAAGSSQTPSSSMPSVAATSPPASPPTPPPAYSERMAANRAGRQ